MFRELLRSILLVFLIGLLVGLSVKLLAIILKTEITKPEVLEWIRYAPNSILLIITLIFGFTFVPVIEELYFRGFLYNALKTRFSVFIAGILQALFFAALHQYNLLNTVGLFLTGIALAVVYERRKNLLSPISIYAMMNTALLVPILILAIYNLHTPASNWEEATTQPVWLKPIPIEEIERQESGMKQWEYDLLSMCIYCSTQRELRDFPHIIFSLGFSQWTGWRMRNPGGAVMHRLLVVDDYDCMRELIKEELVDAGYAVETTAEFESVPDVIRALKPDMVIMELYVQKRPRWDVLIRIKTQSPSLPVLIVTTIEGFKNDPRASVADGFVLKSVCFDDLKKKVSRFLRPKMIEDSEVAHAITSPEAAVGLSLVPR